MSEGQPLGAPSSHDSGSIPPREEVAGRRLIVGLLFANMALTAVLQVPLIALVPSKVATLDPVHKVANLAILTTIASVLAVIGAVAGGAVSDRTVGRFGRRTPWLAGCSIASLVLLTLLPLAGGYRTYAAIFAAETLAATLFQGAFYPILPDRVPETMRGLASGVLGIAAPAGILIGDNLVSRVPPFLSYSILGILLVAASTLLVALAPEAPRCRSSYSTRPGENERVNIRARMANAIRMMLPAFRSRDFSLAFAARLALFLAYFSLLGYNFYVLQDRVGVQNLPFHNLTRAVGWLTSVNTAAWIIFVIPSGWMADRLGRQKLIVGIASFGLAAGMAVPAFSRSWDAMLVSAGLSGAFFGIYISVDMALISKVLPNTESSGRDMALLTAAAAAPQIFAPALAAAIISLVGYQMLFLFAASASALGGLLILKIKSIR